MSGYVKLFSSILTSTIWQEPKETKLLWITMLAMSNRDGIVEGSVPGLAKAAGITLDEAVESLKRLSDSDFWSRTKTNEGRRIQEIDGGWYLLNHGKYRALMNLDERREYNRRKQAEYRAKKALSLTVIDSEQSVHIPDSREQIPDTKPKTLGSAVASPASDESFFLSLASNPAYQGIDLKIELGKMTAWCSEHQKQPTRRRFINWLNRADRPIAGSLPGFQRPASAEEHKANPWGTPG